MKYLKSRTQSFWAIFLGAILVVTNFFNFLPGYSQAPPNSGVRSVVAQNQQIAQTPTAQSKPTSNQQSPETIIEEVGAIAGNPNDYKAVMEWVARRTAAARLPFCWKQSDPRGVGKVPGRVADCPDGFTNNGLTCGRGADTNGAPSKLAKCPDGFTNTGLTCYQGPDSYGNKCRGNCRPGYKNTGCTCLRLAISRGADSMECPQGYSLSKITRRCSQDCPDGYTNTGETCFRPAATRGIDSMSCKPDERKVGARCFPSESTCGAGREQDAGLCYPSCKAGFTGVGPVCWQKCPGGTAIDCGAGCAATKAECANVVVDQVISPLTLVANIATFGGWTAATSTTRTGKAWNSFVTTFQTIKPTLKPGQERTIITVIAASRLNGNKKVETTRKIGLAGYNALNAFKSAYADDFKKQTSAAIDNEINLRLSPKNARFIKENFAEMQAASLIRDKKWQIATTTLSSISLLDITGIFSTANAFTKPICQDASPFPTLSEDYSKDS